MFLFQRGDNRVSWFLSSWFTQRVAGKGLFCFLRGAKGGDGAVFLVS